MHSIISKLFRKFRQYSSNENKSTFKRNFIAVAKANVIARFLALIITPLLTRIYTPDVFGLVASYAVIVSFSLSFCTWKFDRYIPNSNDESETGSLAVIGFSILLFTVLVASAVIATGGMVSVIDYGQLGTIVYLIPVAILVGGLSLLMQGYQVKWNDLRALSKSDLIGALISAILVIALGLAYATHYSIILGRFAGVLASLLVLCFLSRTLTKSISFNGINIRKTLSVYGSEATWNTAAAIVNSANLLAPVFLFAKYFGSSEAGLYSLMFSIGAAPVAVLGSALNKSFWSEAAILYRNSKYQALHNLYKSVTRKLLIVSILTAVGCLIASLFVEIVLGAEKWQGAGIVLIALIPRICGSILFGITNHLTVLKKKSVQLITDSLSLLLTIIAIAVGVTWEIRFSIVVAATSAGAFTGYFLLYLLQLREHDKLLQQAK